MLAAVLSVVVSIASVPQDVQGPLEPPSPAELAAAVTRGVEVILELQETGTPPLADIEGAEWPYEGVYRVRGGIPIGYRVGGTAISSLALLAAPGYTDDPARQEAVARATRFVCAALDEPLMNPQYDGGYDVRGWGHCYALHMLLRLAKQGAIPEGMEEEVARRTKGLVATLEKTEIPQVGGWNYARPPGWVPSPSSPFMTAPVLQALFEAKAQGHVVDEAVITRALDALERCRTESGSFAYSAGLDSPPRRDGTPGAMGRMLSGETVLLTAGRGSVAQVRGALDAFLAHWLRLEERRAKSGTHLPPFGVAPYYFYFAHWHAAQAIELLPPQERPEYIRRTLELLFRTRDEDGRWNDRVFPRSASYGTACAVLSILLAQDAMPEPSEAPQRRRRPGRGAEPPARDVTSPMPVDVPTDSPRR